MLNSAEHEILNAHKYENIKKSSYFLAHKGWHFNIYEQENICSAGLSMNKVHNLGPDLQLLTEGRDRINRHTLCTGRIYDIWR